jgi:hypothetical protein
MSEKSLSTFYRYTYQYQKYTKDMKDYYLRRTDVKNNSFFN